MSYIVLRCGWCDIFLNAQAPSEDKSNYSKDDFYEELEQVCDNFPTYHMKIVLGDFNAQVGRENIFKPTIGNKSLPQDSNDNGVRIVSLPHKNIELFRILYSRIETFVSTVHLEFS